MSDLLFEVECWLWDHPHIEMVLQIGVVVWAIRGTYLFVNRYILKRR
ncbi:hypothetical protein [Treponema socranskii]|nr:hypothetical protein [Treponema socranskii]